MPELGSRETSEQSNIDATPVHLSICNQRDNKEEDMDKKRGMPVATVPEPDGLVMFPDQQWAEIGRALNLSARQLQIVRGIFDDKIQYAIAADLGISPHTVHTHIERLYRKLGVTNRAQLLMRVMTEFVTLVAPRTIVPPTYSVVQTTQR